MNNRGGGITYYKPRKVNIKSLSDDDSYDEEEIIYENGDEEGYLFSSHSK